MYNAKKTTPKNHARWIFRQCFQHVVQLVGQGQNQFEWLVHCPFLFAVSRSNICTPCRCHLWRAPSHFPSKDARRVFGQRIQFLAGQKRHALVRWQIAQTSQTQEALNPHLPKKLKSLHAFHSNASKQYTMEQQPTTTAALAIESDVYQPSIGEDGQYKDYLPPSTQFVHGLRCNCNGEHSKQVYNSRINFGSHLKTMKHQRWLANLNANQANHFTDNIELNEVVSSQKIILARLEQENAQLRQEIATKLRTIDYLSQQLMMRDTKTNSETDLLNLD